MDSKSGLNASCRARSFGPSPHLEGTRQHVATASPCHVALMMPPRFRSRIASLIPDVMDRRGAMQFSGRLSAGDMMFSSVGIALDPANAKCRPGDQGEERQTLKQIHVLTRHGHSPRRSGSAPCPADIAEWQAFNEATSNSQEAPRRAARSQRAASAQRGVGSNASSKAEEVQSGLTHEPQGSGTASFALLRPVQRKISPWPSRCSVASAWLWYRPLRHFEKKNKSNAARPPNSGRGRYASAMEFTSRKFAIAQGACSVSMRS